MDALEGLVQSFSPEEKLEAKDLEITIKSLAGAILEHKQSLERNYVKLSQCIDEIRRKKYWLLGNYKTFGEYLADCEKKYGIGHSQLYVGMKVARNLLPSVPEKDLVEMGITKAGKLSKYVEQSGQTTIPEEVLSVARDPKKTSEDLDQVVNTKLHNVLPVERGKWYALEGFYVDDDEKQEILDAIDLAKSIDPVIPNSIPEWRQRKEIMLRWVREFLGTYS